MGARSLIGQLDNKTQKFRAASCYNFGEPSWQVLSLITAVHTYHQGDSGKLIATLLQHTWSWLDPEAATEAVEDHWPDAIAGIGFRYLNEPVHVVEGRIGQLDGDPDYPWLYLFEQEGHLVLFGNEQGRWKSRGLLHTSEFAAIAQECAGSEAMNAVRRLLTRDYD